MVYRLLGWNAPVFAGRTCAGVSPLGGLSAEELVFSNSPAGWLCRSHPSSCSCWRGLASGLYPWHPGLSFRRSSLSTSAGCPWRRHSFPLLPPAFGGEGGRLITSLVEVDSGLSHGPIPRDPQLFRAGSKPCCGSISLALMAFVPPPMLLPAAKRGVAAHPPHGRRSRRAQVHRIRGVPCVASHTAPTLPGGSYKTSYAVGVAAAFLDGLVLTPIRGRERGPLRTC
jgi:hypothetical protein